jgi:hypothetical protein
MAEKRRTGTYSSRQREKGNYESNRQSLPTSVGSGGSNNRGGNLQQLGVVMTNTDSTDDEKFWDDFFGIGEWANGD